MAKRQPIIVDGANVAYEEESRRDRPRVSNIVAMVKHLEQQGYEPLVIVDASLRHEIDDPDQLEALINAQKVWQVPAGTSADYFILETADERHAQIVTNDRLQDYRDRFPWIDERRVPFMIIQDRVQLYEPKLRGQ